MPKSFAVLAFLAPPLGGAELHQTQTRRKGQVQDDVMAAECWKVEACGPRAGLHIPLTALLVYLWAIPVGPGLLGAAFEVVLYHT